MHARSKLLAATCWAAATNSKKLHSSYEAIQNTTLLKHRYIGFNPELVLTQKIRGARAITHWFIQPASNI